MSDATDDAELLAAWRQGDRGAGDELVKRHVEAVRRFLSAYAHADVEELTQRTFTACVEGRDRIRDGTSLRAYLLGTARRLLMKSWDAKKKRAVTTPSRIGLASPVTTPTQRLRRDDERRLFDKALADLPEEFRDTLERFYLREHPIKRIADELGVAVGTVKSRLSRGREQLRRAISALAAPADQRDSLITHLGDDEPS